MSDPSKMVCNCCGVAHGDWRAGKGICYDCSVFICPKWSEDNSDVCLVTSTVGGTDG